MNELKDYLEELISDIQKDEEMGPDDYTGPDGLLYCGKCRTKKQHRITIFGKERIVPVLCDCQAEERKRELEELDRREKINAIRRAKNSCIHDKALINCTFENDDGSLPILDSARKYVETWPKRKENNNGLLLWGDVGTGKSFYAACIANALIEEGVSVMMTNFAKILNRLSGLYSEDKNAFIADLMKYSLLILDDFGAERNTDYAMEQVFYVIDERYKTNLPLIVTTNISLDDLEGPKDQAHQRVYDRLLAMCTPVYFRGKSHRIKDKERKYRECSEIFEGGKE